jgi:hypothetical protein
MKTIKYFTFIALLTLFLKTSVNAQVSFDFETGSVFTGYNDVCIPGDKGTFFSLKNDEVYNFALFHYASVGFVLSF